MKHVIKINSLSEIRAIAKQGFANQPDFVVGLNYWIQIGNSVLHVTVDRALEITDCKE
jgi:hypothetical protein